MIYKIFLCSTVLLLSNVCFNEHIFKSSNANIYDFGDSVQLYLKKIYDSHINDFSNEEDSLKRDCFLVIRRYDKGFGVSFNYLPTERLKTMMKSNNVYYEIDKNVLIPIISDYDLTFSNYLREGKNSRTVYQFHGPVIKFDHDGKIIR